MKFDRIIMNPPYSGSLHLKILSEAMKHADEIVNLSPIRWLQDPLAEYKKNSDWNKYQNIIERMKSLDEIPKSDAQKYFDIVNSEDLGVYHITKKGSWKDFDEKEIIKKCYHRVKDSLVTIDHNMKDGWRVRISTISNNNHRNGALNNLGKLIVFKDGMKDEQLWYNFYQKNKWSKTTSEITDSIKFNSEEEAVNFIKSVEETKFGRWYEAHIITDMNISNKNVLWLSDYTHPWTDEMLYEYFELTEEEVKIIEEEINFSKAN